MLRGDPVESYAELLGYFYILENYPSSIVNLESKKGDKFWYAFVALEASIKG